MTERTSSSPMDRTAGTRRTGGVKKTLLHRLFKVGTLPRRLRAALEAEGLVLVDEGLRGSVAFHRFRAPGKRFSRRREWFTGAVALTRARFVAFAYGRRLVDVPLDDPRLGEVEARVDAPSWLVLGFDAGLFHPERSGRIEVRIRTRFAAEIAERLRTGGQRRFPSPRVAG